MKILVEAVCAEFGGIRTYVEHLLETWHDVHPDDELTVIVDEASSLPTFGHERFEVRIKRPVPLWRPLTQTRAMRRLVRRDRPAAVLATLPSTAVVRVGRPTAVVLYDLRHELRPEQFSRKQRILRRISYALGYRIADGFLSISRRSLDDLHRGYPRLRSTPGEVAYLGGDHVLTWGEPDRDGPAIAYAHHGNKNLDLVLDAWALMAAEAPAPVLRVLGIGNARRAGVQADIDARGLTDVVELAPFLPDDEFQQAMLSASMIVFPSDFEGFGLPVVEGMLLGKPVIIGPEAATTEVAGGHAFRMDDWTPAQLAAATRAAEAATPDQLSDAHGWASEFTWRRTVESTRSMLVRLAT